MDPLGAHFGSQCPKAMGFYTKIALKTVYLRFFLNVVSFKNAFKNCPVVLPI